MVSSLYPIVEMNYAEVVAEKVLNLILTGNVS